MAGRKIDTEFIPKVIHFCWFGRNPYSPLIEKCMASWQHLTGYEVIRWDEANFDINSNRYVKEAYQAKKWAFVSDYVRLYVLFHYGGIYMDTDVEVVKSLDRFLSHHAFSGFESVTQIPTGIMGAEKEHPWIGELLEYYQDRAFILPNGSYDLTTNVITISNNSEKYGLIRDGKYQVLNTGVHIYPKEYFCPINHSSAAGRISITENTYTIHHFSGSWQPQHQKLLIGVKHRLKGLIGDNSYNFLKDAAKTAGRCFGFARKP